MQFYNRGIQSYRQGKYQQAVDLLTKTLQPSSQSIDAFYTRGRAFMELNKYQQAIHDFSFVMKIQPERTEVYFRRGKAYQKSQQFQQAIQDYDHAIELGNFEKKQCFNRRGNCYLQLKQYENAVKDFNQVISIDSDQLQAFYSRGVAKMYLQQQQSAIVDFDRVIDRDRRDYKAYHNRAMCKRFLEQYQEAVQDYSRAIELNPQFFKSYNNRGSVYLQLKRYEPAFNDFQKALKLSPNNPAILFNMAQYYTEIDQQKIAKKQFQHGIFQFFNQPKEYLKQNFKLLDDNIQETAEMIKQYKNKKHKIQKFRNFADGQGQVQVLAVKQLQKQNTKIAINKIAKLATKQGQVSMRQHQKLKQKFEEMMSAFEQFKQKTNIRLTSVEKRLSDLKVKLVEMDKIIFVDRNIIKKIQKIGNPKTENYYKTLYHMIINHFLAYKLNSTGFFQQQQRIYSDADKVICMANKLQPVAESIPILSSIITIPFEIMENYSELKTSHINKNIAKKIKGSQFVMEKKINQFMAFVIQKLIGNDKFNKRLDRSIQKEQDSYITYFYQKFVNVKDFIFSSVLQSSRIDFSYVEEVVIVHMTLVTRAMYELDPIEFARRSKDKNLFYRLILDALGESVAREDCCDIY